MKDLKKLVKRTLILRSKGFTNENLLELLKDDFGEDKIKELINEIKKVKIDMYYLNVLTNKIEKIIVMNRINNITDMLIKHMENGIPSEVVVDNFKKNVHEFL